MYSAAGRSNAPASNQLSCAQSVLGIMGRCGRVTGSFRALPAGRPVNGTARRLIQVPIAARFGKGGPRGPRPRPPRWLGPHGFDNPSRFRDHGRTAGEFRSLRSGMKANVSVPNERRRSRSLACVVAVCGAIGLMAGCASEPESHLVSAPPPPPPSTQPATVYTTAPAYPYATTTTTAPATVAAVPSPTGASSIVVMQAPPAAQQEVPTPRPSRDHVWIPGNWSWKSDHYEWTAGHWEIPPREGAVWVPPRWQPEGSSFRFYEGYWD
jgi:hypothetical protein